jgi:predicted transcriptional regulator
MDQAQGVIGSFIRIVRKDKGLSLEALAASAGISYQYLSCLENGKENFTLQVLGVKPEDITLLVTDDLFD